MANFKVITDESGSYDSYADDGDGYRFNEHGLLITHRGSTGERRTYSPSGWLYIEEDYDARPPVL